MSPPPLIEELMTADDFCGRKVFKVVATGRLNAQQGMALYL